MTDPAAHIDAGATVASDATVGPGARIGTGTQVDPGAYVEGGVVIGKRVRIHRGALIYRGVTIDDDVLVGPGAILTNERYPRAVLIAEDAPAADDGDAGLIHLEAGSSIGAAAVVVAGCDVGPYATVAAGAVVTRSVTGHSLVAGSPARRIGWVCACGRRLNDATGHPAPPDHERYAADPVLTCGSCGRRYRYVPDGDTLAEPAGSLPQGAPA